MAETRGRLSSLDLLPEEAQDALQWAIGELNQRRRTQADILFELNDRLAAVGCDPISKSAFGRKSVRLARRNWRLQERQFIYTGIAEQLTPEVVGKNDLVLGEFIKTLIDELLDGDGLSPKNAMELARAYQSTVSAQRTSADHRRQLQDDAKARVVKAAEDAVGAVTARGHAVDGAEVLRKIREEVYGIREAA
jgi:hypothetical protein